MSVLNRQANPSKERHKNDFYPTKPNFALVHACSVIDYLDYEETHYNVLDVGFGSGVYGDAISAIREKSYFGFTIHGIDVTLDNLPENHKYNFCYDGDFLEFGFDKKYDLIIGKPPYKNVIKFVERSLGLLNRGGVLSFLLKTSFLESKECFEFFKNNRPFSISMLANRPIAKHTESYCIVNWCNDYYNEYNNETTTVNWMYVNKDGTYERI